MRSIDSPILLLILVVLGLVLNHVIVFIIFEHLEKKIVNLREAAKFYIVCTIVIVLTVTSFYLYYK